MNTCSLSFHGPSVIKDFSPLMDVEVRMGNGQSGMEHPKGYRETGDLGNTPVFIHCEQKQIGWSQLLLG